MKNIFKIAAAIPEIRLANPEFNSKKIIGCIEDAKNEQVHLLVFGGVCLTGNVGDLFFQDRLHASVLPRLSDIIENAREIDVLMTIPLKFSSGVHLCAVMLEDGKIRFVTPKNHLSPGERRWFSELSGETCKIMGTDVPILKNGRFSINGNPAEISFSDDIKKTDAALLICLPFSPYSAADEQHILSGAEYLAREKFCCVYASSPVFESTTDSIFPSLGFICDRGEMLEKTEKFAFSTQMIATDIDFDITGAKKAEGFNDLPNILFEEKKFNVKRKLAKNPFFKENSREFFCDVLQMQAHALARRVLHIGSKTLIVGVSGGLDSTLSLVAAINAADILGKDRKSVVAVTMPGFGTSGQTKSNAAVLMENLGVTCLTIPIGEACEKHLKDIGHSGAPDAAFENAQARERTQILLDLANMKDGIVVGTGDMTEIALGFATFNGDHISHYNVNGNIPKTLVRALVRFLGEHGDFNKPIKDAFLAVADTPISPELLPPDEKGEIAQKTEEIVGPYDLNDFIMYYAVKHGLDREKILFWAQKSFPEYGAKLVEKTVVSFYKRFLANQFKRSCSADGVKILDFSLSPRGGSGLSLPSDCDYSLFTGN